jgi:hypothetical protein
MMEISADQKCPVGSRVRSGSAKSVAETKVRCGWGVLVKAARRRVGRAWMRLRMDIWPSSRFGLDLGSLRLVRRVSGTRLARMWGRCSAARTSEVRGWEWLRAVPCAGVLQRCQHPQQSVRQAPPPVNWTSIPNHRHFRFVVAPRRQAETVSRLIHDEVDC